MQSGEMKSSLEKSKGRAKNFSLHSISMGVLPAFPRALLFPTMFHTREHSHLEKKCEGYIKKDKQALHNGNRHVSEHMD